MSTRSIEYLALDEMRPADRNPKRHDHDTLHASIGRFGFVEPIIRDDRTGRLVAGHGRLDELRRSRARDAANPPAGVQLGDDGRWLVPVITGWSSTDDAEAQAYVVASNRAVESGGWDDELLSEVLGELEALDGLEGVGFGLDDVLDRLGDGDDSGPIDARPQLDDVSYRLVVDCDDEQHQAELIERLSAEGLSVRAVFN